MEYITSVTPSSYTTNVVDETYPTYSYLSSFAKSSYIIYDEIIYQARKQINKVANFVYDTDDITMYRSEDNIFLDPTATEIETNQTVYDDDTTILYLYTDTDATLDFTSITLSTDARFTSQGVQLNGYETEPRIPSDSSIYWKKIYAINSKRAFDSYNYTKTIAPTEGTGEEDPSEIEYVFTTSNVDRLTFFGLDANEIDIKVHLTSAPESSENTVEYTYSLLSRDGELTFTSVLYANLIQMTSKIVTIPTASVMEITVTIRRNTGYAQVGDITLGKSNQIAEVLDGITVNTNDYSQYIEDDDGNEEYQEGGYRKTISLNALFDTDRKNIVTKELDGLRGIELVFRLDPNSDDEVFQIKGFLKTTTPTITTNSEKSALILKIESRLEK